MFSTKKPAAVSSQTDSSIIELTEAETDVVCGGFKFDGVDGESSHKDHKGEIELESWSIK